MHRDDLQREVEEIKQDAKVQQALKQASLTKKIKGPVARARDKFVIGTHVVLLVALAVIYKLLEFWSQRLNERYPELSQYYPLALKLVVAIAALVVSLIILRLLDLYFLNRIADAVYQYNLKRVSRLVIWLVIGFLVLTIFFQNWYTAVVSFGLISLILGFALQTPITSFIGWIYILARQPYRVGDRIKIGDAQGDVIDVNYLDTTLWEFGGDFLSTEHPSGRIIKFPNSNVLSTPVYNYTWPVFPYIWNEIKFHIAYNSDLEFVANTMREVTEEEVGEGMMTQVAVFREILAQTPVNQLEVHERPMVMFRVSDNTWLEAIVRYLVHPKDAGRVKSRLIRELLTRLNAEPDRVMFPKSSIR
jgi:small-conductance mechanosensitive channel